MLWYSITYFYKLLLRDKVEQIWLQMSPIKVNLKLSKGNTPLLAKIFFYL